MDFTEEEHNEAFHQARLKFSRVVKAPKEKIRRDLVNDKPKQMTMERKIPFVRPKAEYSNRSPYGIYSPGIKK